MDLRSSNIMAISSWGGLLLYYHIKTISSQFWLLNFVYLPLQVPWEHPLAFKTVALFNSGFLYITQDLQKLIEITLYILYKCMLKFTKNFYLTKDAIFFADDEHPYKSPSSSKAIPGHLRHLFL